MKYTQQEISLYNAEAYEKITHGMQIIRGSDKWIAPDIEEQQNDKRSTENNMQLL
jgi:hypothetical protein